MKAGITLKHHDWSYVERRGGPELLTHLRGGQVRSEFRRACIERAYQHFVPAELRKGGESETGGLALIVVQRALIAAEDLGGLFHCLRSRHPWAALRGAAISDLDAAYEWVAAGGAEVARDVFLLPEEQVLRAEGHKDEVVNALLQLRHRSETRWLRMSETAATLWLSLRDVAKATMHGFPVCAGEHLFEPPGGGELADGLERSPYGRAALVVNSFELATQDGVEVRTERKPVRLDRVAVTSYRSAGKVAARLYGELCEAHAGTQMSGHASHVPCRSARTLSLRDQKRLAIAAETTHE